MRRLRIGRVARAMVLWLGLAPQAVAAAPQAPTTKPAESPSSTTNANTEGRPFLWRVDGEVPHYLFGTFHLPDDRIADLDPEVERALAGVDALFTEIDMDKAMSPALMKAMVMADGKTLSDVAPPDLVARVREELGATSEAAAAVNQMRPWVVAMQVMVGKRRSSAPPLDLMIWKDAKSAGKEVGGLETIEEQLSVFDGLGIDGEVDMLKSTLDQLDDYRKKGLDLTEEMIRVWCAGDTRRMLGFFEAMEGTGSWRILERTLLTDRNVRMAERIDRKLRAEPRRKFAFAVGAGHLIGATNIVDLLRARGYVVTRIPESLANVAEELEQLEQEVAARQARIEQLLAKKAALDRPPVKKAG